MQKGDMKRSGKLEGTRKAQRLRGGVKIEQRVRVCIRGKCTESGSTGEPHATNGKTEPREEVVSPRMSSTLQGRHLHHNLSSRSHSGIILLSVTGKTAGG